MFLSVGVGGLAEIFLYLFMIIGIIIWVLIVLLGIALYLAVVLGIPILLISIGLGLLVKKKSSAPVLFIVALIYFIICLIVTWKFDLLNFVVVAFNNIPTDF